MTSFARLLKSMRAIVFSIPIVISSRFVAWNYWFIFGFIAMGLVNWLWWHGGYVGSKYDRSLEFLEHYHWSILSSILSIILTKVSYTFSSITYGATLILWVDECFYQDHPFATESNHEKLSDFIGVILITFWFIMLVKFNF